VDSILKKILKTFISGPERGKLKKASPARLRGLRVSIVSAIMGILGAILSVAGMKSIGVTMFILGFIGIFVGDMLSLAS